MIVEKSMHSGWLSNSYLVGDHEGGTGVLIDAGGPVMPLIEAVGRHTLTMSHLLVTHADPDHIAEADTYTGRFDLQVLAHPLEAERMTRVDGTLADGDQVTAGDLTNHRPPHARPQPGAPLVPRERRRLLHRRRPLPRHRRRHHARQLREPAPLDHGRAHEAPSESLGLHRAGHTDPTTIGAEWEENVFVRLWRGVDPAGDEQCTVNGRAGDARALRARL